MNVFEAGMLICFGVSWPCSLLKVLRTGRVEGKSVLFMWLVLMGYFSGITHKVLNDTDWVTAIYVLNAVFVALDIAAYYHYSRVNRREVPA